MRNARRDDFRPILLKRVIIPLLYYIRIFCPSCMMRRWMPTPRRPKPATSAQTASVGENNIIIRYYNIVIYHAHNEYCNNIMCYECRYIMCKKRQRTDCSIAIAVECHCTVVAFFRQCVVVKII